MKSVNNKRSRGMAKAKAQGAQLWAREYVGWNEFHRTPCEAVPWTRTHMPLGGEEIEQSVYF